jgi:SAM-dependent methyltransferase
MSERFAIAPYFDDLLARLEAGDATSRAAYGRHVHWGWWPDPATATGTAEDYGAAAERMCHLVCDAAGIRDGQRVLDVGCGFGGTIASLNDRFRNLDLLGVNIDPRQVKRARDTIQPVNGNRIQFEVGDACDLKVPEAAFDVALAVECIFHFESRAAFFAGVSKALKPGGRLMVSDFVPTPDALPLLEKNNAGTDDATRTSYGKVDLLCTEERYRSMADAVGLKLDGARDITAGTLPTYAFMRGLLPQWTDKQAARAHGRASNRLELACESGWLKYTVLTFTRV